MHSLEERDLRIDKSVGLEYPMNLRDDLRGVGHMLEHRDRNDRIELRLTERKIVCVAEHVDCRMIAHIRERASDSLVLYRYPRLARPQYEQASLAIAFEK